MRIDVEPLEQEVRIELVPLIDVIFCILTFFILAAVTLTRQTAINVDLPKANTGAAQMREILVVSVDPIGQTYLEKQPVSRDQLYQAMVNFRQVSPDGLTVLYASRAASYNDVVQVLDLLRSVGGDRVALATLPSTGDDAEPQIPGSIPGLDNPESSFDPSQLPGSTDPLNLPSSLPGLDTPGLDSTTPATPQSGNSSSGTELPGTSPSAKPNSNSRP